MLIYSDAPRHDGLRWNTLHYKTAHSAKTQCDVIRCQSYTTPANHADASKGSVASSGRKLKQLQRFASQIVGPNGRCNNASEALARIFYKLPGVAESNKEKATDKVTACSSTNVVIILKLSSDFISITG